MLNKTVDTSNDRLIMLLNAIKLKKMCDEAVDTCLLVFDFVPD